MSKWIDRADALTRLGVKPQTLYAYVSRGRIAMKPDPLDPRKSLYNADDIEGLKVRRARGRSRSAVASSTMTWGEPSLQTSISTVDHGQLIYRGVDAVDFAQTASWEDAAELLWQRNSPVALFTVNDKSQSPFAALAALANDSYPALGRSEDRLQADAVRAITQLAGNFGAASGDAPLHERLARGWAVDPQFADWIRLALVLVADHELNASTFAVRVTASTGASIAASLLAGLCALSGPRHGGAAAEALLLLDEARLRGPAKAIHGQLVVGRHLPGFGHPLYPAGDPRANALLQAVPLDEFALALSEEGTSVTGHHPNVDFALSALTRACGLPDNAPYCLFALGRSIGWAAHAIEQVTNGNLIRPRANYVGPRHNSLKTD